MPLKIVKILTENIFLYLLFYLLSKDPALSVICFNTWASVNFFGKKLRYSKTKVNHFMLTFLMFFSFGTSIYIAHTYGKNISPAIDTTEFTIKYFSVSILLFLITASISTFLFWRAQKSKSDK